MNDNIVNSKLKIEIYNIVNLVQSGIARNRSIFRIGHIFCIIQNDIRRNYTKVLRNDTS